MDTLWIVLGVALNVLIIDFLYTAIKDDIKMNKKLTVGNWLCIFVLLIQVALNTVGALK